MVGYMQVNTREGTIHGIKAQDADIGADRDILGNRLFNGAHWSDVMRGSQTGTKCREVLINEGAERREVGTIVTSILAS